MNQCGKKKKKKKKEKEKGERTEDVRLHSKVTYIGDIECSCKICTKSLDSKWLLRKL
jgi:hypothetical protein